MINEVIIITKTNENEIIINYGIEYCLVYCLIFNVVQACSNNRRGRRGVLTW